VHSASIAIEEMDKEKGKRRFYQSGIVLEEERGGNLRSILSSLAATLRYIFFRRERRSNLTFLV